MATRPGPADPALRQLLDLLAADAPAEHLDRPLAEARATGAGPGEPAGLAEATGVARAVHRTLTQRRRREAELVALFDTASDLAALRDPDAVLRAIVHRARTLLGTDIAYLTLNDPVAGDTFMRVTDGSVSVRFQQLRLGMGEGLGGLVAQIARPVLLTPPVRRVHSPVTSLRDSPACWKHPSPSAPPAPAPAPRPCPTPTTRHAAAWRRFGPSAEPATVRACPNLASSAASSVTAPTSPDASTGSSARSSPMTPGAAPGSPHTGGLLRPRRRPHQSRGHPPHIHVNTVVRRPDRIARLLGPGWNTLGRAVEIHVALRLHRRAGRRPAVPRRGRWRPLRGRHQSPHRPDHPALRSFRPDRRPEVPRATGPGRVPVTGTPEGACGVDHRNPARAAERAQM